VTSLLLGGLMQFMFCVGAKVCRMPNSLLEHVMTEMFVTKTLVLKGNGMTTHGFFLSLVRYNI
jgi:hypothetical protein